MIQKQERVGGTTKTTSYAYDSMNRLETIYEPDANSAQRTVAYTYDSRGNRDTEIETITATNEVTYTEYDYTDNNRLQYVTKREDDQNGTIIQRKEYVYDNNGNQTNVYDVTNGQSTITTNTYTLLNELKSTETTGIDKLMENTYNAEGKRVAKTVDGVTVRYFYEYNNVAFEYTNSGAVSAFNVIGINLISRETGSDKVYYFNNGHADVTALLDATTKNIRSQYRYDEFGNITSETYYDSNGVETTDENEIIKSQILYAGYQYDEESKYYNLHARYYDPQTARFLQQDTYRGTIADPLSLNLYTYCHNEPMMYYDPTGHELTKWDQAHLSKDEQKKILEYSLQWSHADKMLKSATFPAVISAYENAKEVAHDKAEEIRNKYRTEREYGGENGYTTYVTENGTVYKDSPASYEYIKNYLSNSASEGTGNAVTLTTTKGRLGDTVYSWKGEDGTTIYTCITDDYGSGIGALTKEQKESNAQYIYNYLTDKGWFKESIAGLLGNMEQESGINPAEWQKLNKTEFGYGYGLVQWTPNKFSPEKYLDWKGLNAEQANEMAQKDPKQLMDSQLEYLLLDLDPSKGEWGDYGNKSPYKNITLNDYIHNTKKLSAGELAMVWQAYYERPEHIDTKRIGFADKWLNFFNNK